MNNYVIIDGRFKSIGEELKKYGFNVILTKKNMKVYDAISFHPDIQLFVDEEEKKIFVDKQFYEYYAKRIKGYEIIEGEAVEGGYPNSAKYNAVKFEKKVVHNFKYTEKNILKHIEKKKYKKIDVKQGYTNCNIINLKDKLITEDNGIYKNLKNRGEKILKLNKVEVDLIGMNYGFIGGATGFFENKLFFTGEIKKNPYYIKIKEFVGNNVEMVSLNLGRLQDVGTIIFMRGN
ncbi:DUF6873 family GME fold protein [Haliovirga abyssi]|uniref:Galectin domain-containing protein n=1 Tax=Haliovirga abyssi TaxID=2996794 RepID=A0AAU9DQB5_9FUSO|nr:hypothetical protein [Haliovirga abyssi]BDU50653.1 hypothetical protein HLVA_12220 [Haliovirga abyssi]